MGAVTTGLSITSIGLHYKVQRMMSNRSNTNAYRQIRDAAELPLFDIKWYGLRIISSTDLTLLLTWCDQEYEELLDVEFNDDFDDPETATLNAYATRDLCNRFRNSLKSALKMLCTRITEINDVLDQHHWMEES